MKKRKKTIKKCNDIFQENKKDLKANNCQKLLYANQKKFFPFKW